MSEFSSTMTERITPQLKALGFRKRGAYSGSPTHDAALYCKGHLQVLVTWRFHPYDAPSLGVELEIKKGRRVLVRKLLS